MQPPPSRSLLVPLANCFTALFNHLLRRETRAELPRFSFSRNTRAPPTISLCPPLRSPSSSSWNPSVFLPLAIARDVLLTCDDRSVDVAKCRNQTRRILFAVSRCFVSHRYRLSRNYFSKVQSSRPVAGQTPVVANYCRSTTVAVAAVDDGISFSRNTSRLPRLFATPAVHWILIVFEERLRW